MGAALLDNSAGLGDADWILTSVVHDAEEDLGKEAVQQALDRAARDDPRVRTYVRAVEAIESEVRARRDALPASGAEVSARRANDRVAPYARVKRAIVDAEPPGISLTGFRY